MRSLLTTIAVDATDRRVLLDTIRHVEAPNWTPDGRWLVVNSDGALYRVDAEVGGEPERIECGDPAPFNNDHVLSPDGSVVYASANDGHIYAVPLAGGAARRVTRGHPSGRREFHFLHGVSPDGWTLAYVLLVRDGGWTHEGIWTAPVAGGDHERLLPGVPPKDGPEYSSDGSQLYFNGDASLDHPGHSQLFRLDLLTRAVEQLTDDDRVNWFPHPSPDGRLLVHLSYPPGTRGHPAGRNVTLRLSDPSGKDVGDVVRLVGGQGTINVPSWSPDSRRFAYVSYGH